MNTGFRALRTIIAPLDGSSFSERALPYAVDLAKASGARVIALRAAQAPPTVQAIVDPIDAKFDMLDVAEAELASTVAHLNKAEVSIEPHVYSGEPAQAIVHAARLNDADVIVMATHGRSGLAGLMYGNVADRVTRTSHLPVLLVPITCETSWAPDQTRRILVCLDGSALAEEVLDPAVFFARSLDSELMLTRVIGGAHAGDGDAAAAQTYLDAVADRLRQEGQRVGTRLVEGHAPERIAALAREMDARMIAMATHGRSGIARHVLGSVATEVLYRTTVPLLVVRPARIRWQAIGLAEFQPASESSAVSVTLTCREAELLAEAVELLLSTTQKEEHLARPLLELTTKLKQAQREKLTAVEAG